MSRDPGQVSDPRRAELAAADGIRRTRAAERLADLGRAVPPDATVVL